MISDDQIIGVLKPHFEIIASFHTGGLKMANKVSDLFAEGNCRLQKRYKSGLANNYIIEAATLYFKKIEGIKVDTKYDSLVLYFDSGIISRFKKIASVIKNPCKISTRNRNFIQGTLFEAPAVPIEITFVANEVFSEIEQIIIIKRVDKIPIPIAYIYNNTNEESPKTFKAMELVLPDEQDEQLSIKTNT